MSSLPNADRRVAGPPPIELAAPAQDFVRAMERSREEMARWFAIPARLLIPRKHGKSRIGAEIIAASLGIETAATFDHGPLSDVTAEQMRARRLSRWRERWER